MTELGATIRTAAPAAVALFAALGVGMSDRPVAVGVAAAVGSVAVATAVAWRDLTGWPLAVSLVPLVGGITLIGHATASNLTWMGLCVAIGWVALTSEAVVAIVSATALAAVLASEWLRDTSEPGWAAWLTGTVFTMVACVFSRRLRLTLEELRAAQHQLAERSRAEERSRIAGEVHDVIGHALTVSLLHLGSARLALDEDPDEARRAVEEAERQTRASLEEVRSTVGLLRTDAPGLTTPLPTAADLDELVDSYRRAGSAIDLTVNGDLSTVGPTRGLAAYRIVQEALTNAIRHTPGRPVTVAATVDERRMTVVVHNPGDSAAPAEPGSGIRGMRERAESLGGTLVAGPDPDRKGWLVEAVLPA